MQTIPMTMQNMLLTAQQRHKEITSVESCLAYPEMMHVPPAFNRMAHTELAILSEADENLEWEDYCPAYALGLLTFEAYFHAPHRGRSGTELKDQWNGLRGSSRLGWEQAQPIIARCWNALAGLEREGQLQA